MQYFRLVDCGDMESNKKAKNLIFIIGIAFLLGLAFVLWIVPVDEWNLDSRILLLLQDKVRNPILNPIFIGITTLGNAGTIRIMISIALCVCKKTRRIGMICACSIAVSFLINNLLLKNLVGRIRPYEVITALQPLVAKPIDQSFPSGHTSSGFSVAWILFRNVPKRFGIPAVLLAALIGISRLYVGVHYPTDVLVGMISGIGCACLAEVLVKYYEQRKNTG